MSADPPSHSISDMLADAAVVIGEGKRRNVEATYERGSIEWTYHRLNGGDLNSAITDEFDYFRHMIAHGIIDIDEKGLGGAIWGLNVRTFETLTACDVHAKSHRFKFDYFGCCVDADGIDVKESWRYTPVDIWQSQRAVEFGGEADGEIKPVTTVACLIHGTDEPGFFVCILEDLISWCKPLQAALLDCIDSELYELYTGHKARELEKEQAKLLEADAATEEHYGDSWGAYA